MAVEFTRDYRGKLTGEKFYLSGMVADFDANTERALIARGAAKNITPADPVEESPATPTKVTRRRSKKK